MMGFNRRFHPVIEQAREILVQGGLGKIHAIQTVASEPPPTGKIPQWRQHRTSGGGVMLELASHHIDLLRWLLNDEIARVEARIVSELSEGVKPPGCA